MCLGLCAVGEGDLGKVLACPPLVWKVIAPDDPEMFEAAVKEAGGQSGSWLARLLGRGQAGLPTLELSEEGYATADLDKAWHGIHYLLTGSAWEGEWPLSFLLLGGAEVGKVDVGYGPARAFTPAEVKEIAGALGGVDEPALRARFHPAEMTRLDIYPTVIWNRDPADDDTLGYCVEYFLVLKAFVEQAAARQRGLLIYLC